eukprot:NODE_3213_length_2074_cov_6.702619.p1 GENE.NODE_3213_length_2074_cov_6.702619~~NODE_3213_length_2074_cov_6.702619.p1  ORF type:complete len:606 (+),score=129.58 NODE_3213_length_2074_cov_6.702619:78-1895(+)
MHTSGFSPLMQTRLSRPRSTGREASRRFNSRVSRSVSPVRRSTEVANFSPHEVAPLRAYCMPSLVYTPVMPYAPTLLPPTAGVATVPYRFQPLGSPPAPVASIPEGAAALEPWIRAARNFELSSDFDLDLPENAQQLDLPSLMQIMKTQSQNKRTIQVLADKHLLSKMLDNLSVPQLPTLLVVRKEVHHREVASFVDTHLMRPGAPDVIAKPTHLSNGTGVLVLRRVAPEERDDTVAFLLQHMKQFLLQHAAPHESLALQSLTPGFVVQPRYQSVVGFKTPLELRVIALWGRARVGVWWWGRSAEAVGEAPNRNLWLVRRPVAAGELSDDDGWEAVHEHIGNNPGFDSAVALFTRHIPAMAATTEAIAVAVGTPFLRADFFVGSVEHGVRLNEVAYGCGLDYRRRAGDGRVINDAPSIARILQEGFAQRPVMLPAKRCLARLGVHGQTYATLVVSELPSTLCPRLTVGALTAGGDVDAEELTTPEEFCRTVHAPVGGRVPVVGTRMSLPPARVRCLSSGLCLDARRVIRIDPAMAAAAHPTSMSSKTQRSRSAQLRRPHMNHMMMSMVAPPRMTLTTPPLPQTLLMTRPPPVVVCGCPTVIGQQH